MGVNDYLSRPIDRNELVARVRTQIRRKRHADHLRDRLDESVEFAITDALTGLHNRRYMERHLAALADQAKAARRPLSVVVADIDHFKSINDTYGHDSGDSVLRQFAARFRRYTRSMDLACRVGGEEFIIIMPETTLEQAHQAGERLCECIASEPFQANRDTRLCVTASVGIATLERSDDSVEALLKRADSALYAAKRDGRNRVVVDAA
jgi:two-component system cell cycle response regulator